MCGLCGALGAGDHWADAVARDGIYNPADGPVLRRRERARRVTLANRVLAQYGLRLSDWLGTAFVLASLTGKSEIVADLGHLWPAAEALTGRRCDPLAPDLVARLEAGGG